MNYFYCLITVQTAVYYIFKDKVSYLDWHYKKISFFNFQVTVELTNDGTRAATAMNFWCVEISNISSFFLGGGQNT